MFGLFKKRVDAEHAGLSVAGRFLDPDECRKALSRMEPYVVPPSIATCEMAFAHAAVVGGVIGRLYEGVVRRQVYAGRNRWIADAFALEDTGETKAFYRSDMASVAKVMVGIYTDRLPIEGVAVELLDRIKSAGLLTDAVDGLRALDAEVENALWSVRIVPRPNRSS